MKVLFLVDFLRTIHAGTEGQLAHLLRHLPELGYELELLSVQSSDFLAQEAQTVFPAVGFQTLDSIKKRRHLIRTLARLYRHLKTSKPHIVHTFFPTCNSFGVLVSRLAGVKCIVSTRRDMGYQCSSRHNWLLRIANTVVTKIVVNAGAIRDLTLKKEKVDPRKVCLIRNGISAASLGSLDTSRCRSASAIVGIVSNLNRGVKRVDLFLRAAGIVKRQLPGTQFWIVGDGCLRSKLESLAKDQGLGRDVTFFGRRSDVETLLLEMSVGVLSSDSEGLSNSILEYMRAALPVVATDVGGNSELVRHGVNGLLVPPGNADAMAQAILSLLADCGQAKVMGRNGFQLFCDGFTVQTMIRETCRLYENLNNMGANSTC